MWWSCDPPLFLLGFVQGVAIQNPGAHPFRTVGDPVRFDGDFRIGQRDTEPFLHGLHHGFRHVAHVIELEETGAGGAHAGFLFRFIFVRVTHGCILSVEVWIGVPIPFPAPKSGASVGLGGLPSAVQGCGEVDAGEDAEVFGLVVEPVFEQPLGAILGSLDHLSAVLVGELPRLFERVAFVHGVHPVEGGSSDYEVGGGGHGVLLWCSVRCEFLYQIH